MGQVTAVLHLIRDPIDVVLGFRESALESGGKFNRRHIGWLGLHLHHTFGRRGRAQGRQLAQRGVDALNTADIFNISGESGPTP